MTFQQLPIVGDCPFREKKKKRKKQRNIYIFSGILCLHEIPHNIDAGPGIVAS